MKNFLLWAPRIAGILFVLFLGLFALDVLEEGLGVWGTALALFLHLIPSILLAIAVALAWKWAWVGAAAFIGWAVFFRRLGQRFPLERVCAGGRDSIGNRVAVPGGVGPQEQS